MSTTLEALVVALVIAAPFPIDAAAQLPPRRFPAAVVLQSCIPLTDLKQGSGDGDFRECSVTESGTFGSAGGVSYRYAIYCLIPTWCLPANGPCTGEGFNAGYYRMRGLIVCAAAGADSVDVVFERVSPEIGMLVYRRREMVQRPEGTLLPIAMDGTGDFNQSELYLREGARWGPVDFES